jgi:hypothetical protein
LLKCNTTTTNKNISALYILIDVQSLPTYVCAEVLFCLKNLTLEKTHLTAPFYQWASDLSSEFSQTFDPKLKPTTKLSLVVAVLAI